jgi:hypothetical protein
MSALAKLKRAKEHLNTLKQAIETFHKSAPFEAFTEENKDGDLIFRVRIHKAVPEEEWSLLVGDLIHNLRSALDLRVSELVLANGNPVTRDHAFPLANSAQDYQRVSKGRLVGLTTSQIQVIDSLNPYGGGNTLLYELHALDILDKHRQLIIAGSAQQSVVIDPTELLRKMQADFEIPPMPIAIRPAERDFPLKDGSELFSIKKAARADGVGEKVGFPFEIAYSDGNNPYGEPLIPKMEALTTEVERILGLLK